MAIEALKRRWNIPGNAVWTHRIVPAVFWLWGLNLLDALFTLLYLQLGLAEELNPWLRRAHAYSPWLFFTVKVAAVQLGTLPFFWHAGSKLARTCLHVALSVYAGVLAYHLAFALFWTVRS